MSAHRNPAGDLACPRCESDTCPGRGDDGSSCTATCVHAELVSSTLEGTALELVQLSPEVYVDPSCVVAVRHSTLLQSAVLELRTGSSVSVHGVSVQRVVEQLQAHTASDTQRGDTGASHSH